MKKVPYTNNTANRMTIGGVAVRPGETRYIDETLHPDYRAAAAPPTAPTDPVLELLDNPIKDIVPQLPTLSDEDFIKVWQGEENGKTRSSLLKAFEGEKLRRAEIAEATGGSYDGFLEQLNATEDLAAALKAEQDGDNREPVVAAFEAEIERRAAQDSE